MLYATRLWQNCYWCIQLGLRGSYVVRECVGVMSLVLMHLVDGSDCLGFYFDEVGALWVIVQCAEAWVSRVYGIGWFTWVGYWQCNNVQFK